MVEVALPLLQNFYRNRNDGIKITCDVAGRSWQSLHKKISRGTKIPQASLSIYYRPAW